MAGSNDTTQGDTPRLSDREAVRLLELGHADIVAEKLQNLVPYIIHKHTTINQLEDCWDDVLQEGNIGLLQSFKSWKYGAGSSLATWAYQYVKRAVLKEIDRQFDYYRENVTTDFAEHLEDTEETPLHPTDEAYGEPEAAGVREMEWRAEYDRLRSKLPPRQRLVLDFMRDGYTVRQVAGFLDVSIGAAQTEMTAVKQNCRIIFEQNRECCA